MSCLLSWTEISMIIALEQERFFFFFSSLEGKKKEQGSRPTSFSLSLSYPLIPFHPSTPPPPPFPSSPSSSPPPPFSFLLCPTSQLYTLAVATSIVYFKTPQTRKNQSASFSSFFFSSFYCNEKNKKTYRNLLPQKINIIFTVCQTLLCCVEFGNEECFGFGEGVGEHDVCLFKL